jgi:hypothetical protein
VVILNAKRVYRYHIIWAMHKGGWVDLIDHKNRDSLDDRIENLREATHSQNHFNCGPPANNTSGYKGVTRSSGCKSWVAQMNVDGRHYYLGSFPTAEEASAAYQEAARNMRPEFAG